MACYNRGKRTIYFENIRSHPFPHLFLCKAREKRVTSHVPSPDDFGQAACSSVSRGLLRLPPEPGMKSQCLLRLWKGQWRRICLTTDIPGLDPTQIRCALWSSCGWAEPKRSLFPPTHCTWGLGWALSIRMHTVFSFPLYHAAFLPGAKASV